MFSSFIRLAFFLIVGILIYNYFFGTPAEKATSDNVFKQVRGVFGSVSDVVKSEKEKYEAGKYNQAIDRINSTIGMLKGKAQDIKDLGALEKLGALEQKRVELQQRIEHSKTAFGAKDTAAIKASYQDLVRETDKMIQNMEKSKDFIPN